ncbi:MAG: septum formation protein Maf [Candidatus Kuenenia sp.]|nr:septum formation protein Maf [Candidatus Kuenenia hertensis]
MWIENLTQREVFADKRFVLASNSPQRIKLFKLLGCLFDVIPHGIDENVWDNNLPPHELVQNLASLKACNVAEGMNDVFIIGADTIVLHNNDIYGKPKDQNDAKRILSLLNNSVHEVLSGVCIKEMPSGRESVSVARTKIKMKDISMNEIERYVQSGEPMGKAGAYAIQGEGERFIDKIDGSYSNVVGLPLELLEKMLIDFVKK